MSRLIDADALNKMRFSEGINNEGILYVPYCEVMQNIRNAPTAFDVEKVVDEIKAQFGCRDCEYADVSPTPYVCLGECAELEVINDICDIVKRGGIE